MGGDSIAIGVRIAAILGLAGLVVALVLVLGGREERYEVTAEFENASQLVGGEDVVVGGEPVGSVKRIELGNDGLALVTFSVSDDFAPLPAQTTATIRSTSLASIANRRVELALPTDSDGSAIADGGTLTRARTVSEVDLDQLLNTLDPNAIADLKRVVTGLDRASRGVGGEANRGYHYLNPLLSSSRRTLSELGSDRAMLEQLLVDTSRLSGALAERAPEISSAVRSLNLATNAVGRQREALTRAVADLPDFLRQANTTLVNLRAAADDLDPLLVATRPLAERLGPFFAELRGVAAGAVPTLRDLDVVLRRRGPGDDAVELVRLLPSLRNRAVGAGAPDCGASAGADHQRAADDRFDQGALGEATCTLSNSLPVLAQLRAYSPELVGWFDDFAASGVLDANGGIGRIAGTFNAFSVSPSNGLPDLLSPVDPATLFNGATIPIDHNARCPGSNERDPGDGSVPFTDGGTIRCDPTQMPPGP